MPLRQKRTGKRVDHCFTRDGLTTLASFWSFGDAVRCLPVIERLQPFLSFALAQLCGISHLKKRWSKLNQPFGIDIGDFSHVLLCSKHKFVIYHPFGLTIKQGAWRMDVHNLIICYCAVTLLWVLSCCITEEAACYRLLSARCCLTTRYHIKFVSAKEITLRWVGAKKSHVYVTIELKSKRKNCTTSRYGAYTSASWLRNWLIVNAEE